MLFVDDRLLFAVVVMIVVAVVAAAAATAAGGAAVEDDIVVAVVVAVSVVLVVVVVAAGCVAGKLFDFDNDSLSLSQPNSPPILCRLTLVLAILFVVSIILVFVGDFIASLSAAL